MNKRILLVVAAVVAAVILFIVLRPGGDDENAAPTPTNSTTTTSTTNQETTTAPTTTAGSPPTQVRITYADGRIRGGVKRFSVNRGERVVLVVRSDVADEVHVHGYDIMRDVAPGEPARVAFRAGLVGGFEVELEQRHLLLAEFDVEL